MDIKITGPEWASGCEGCAHGIVHAPEVKGAPLYLARAVLARHGHVLFCECRAGQAAERYANQVWRDLVTGNERLHGATVAAILAEASISPTVHGPEPVSA